MTRIKRLIVVATVLTLAFSAVALALAGCGSDTGKAKGLTQDANTRTTNLNETTGDLGNQLATLYSEGNGGATDKTKFDATESKLKALVDQNSKGITSIQSDFNQIKKIKDVEKYKEYAEVQLQILDLTKQSMDSVTNFLKEVNKIKASGTFDQNAFAEAFTRLRQELGDQGNKSSPLLQQAQKLNEQNKLL